MGAESVIRSEGASSFLSTYGVTDLAMQVAQIYRTTSGNIPKLLIATHSPRMTWRRCSGPPPEDYRTPIPRHQDSAVPA